MTISAPTIAQQIANSLDNDGQQFRTRPTDGSEGVTFTDLVEQYGAYIEPWRDKCRFTFDDRSIITVAGDAWDLGYPDCYCWADAVAQEGHRCQEAEEE
jgi:hypothetical protein